MNIVLNLDKLKEARKGKKLSQDDMAKALGWKSRSKYSKRENGIVSIGASELAIIAKKLGCDMEYFF